MCYFSDFLSLFDLRDCYWTYPLNVHVIDNTWPDSSYIYRLEKW